MGSSGDNQVKICNRSSAIEKLFVTVVFKKELILLLNDCDILRFSQLG